MYPVKTATQKCFLLKMLNAAHTPVLGHGLQSHRPVQSFYYAFCSLRKPDVLEKYLALASFTFFSAACGLTISNPCRGVNATLDAVPETCFFTVVLPPQTCCCFCRFF